MLEGREVGTVGVAGSPSPTTPRLFPRPLLGPVEVRLLGDACFRFLVETVGVLLACCGRRGCGCLMKIWFPKAHGGLIVCLHGGLETFFDGRAVSYRDPLTYVRFEPIDD